MFLLLSFSWNRSYAPNEEKGSHSWPPHHHLFGLLQFFVLLLVRNHMILHHVSCHYTSSRSSLIKSLRHQFNLCKRQLVNDLFLIIKAHTMFKKLLKFTVLTGWLTLDYIQDKYTEKEPVIFSAALRVKVSLAYH